MIIGLFLDGPMKGARMLNTGRSVEARYRGIPFVMSRHGQTIQVMLYRIQREEGKERRQHGPYQN